MLIVVLTGCSAAVEPPVAFFSTLLTRRKIFQSLAAICCAVIAAFFFAAGVRAENARPASSDSSTHLTRLVLTQPLNVEKLFGRWQRSDGNYVLEIQREKEPSALTVGYYNPQPIHIAQASVLSGKAGLRLALRLEDKGYPGSTYTLDYLGASDLLKGIYYHAGLQQNFPVAFRRINSPSAQ